MCLRWNKKNILKKKLVGVISSLLIIRTFLILLKRFVIIVFSYKYYLQQDVLFYFTYDSPQNVHGPTSGGIKIISSVRVHLFIYSVQVTF